MANKKTERLWTNIGTARYPKTNTPHTWDDSLERSVPDEDGKYSIDLVLTGDAAQREISRIKEFAKDLPKKPAKWPFKKVTDESGEESGDAYVFKFAQKGKDSEGKKRFIPHFDRAGKKIDPEGFFLTHNSKVRVEYHPYYYKAQGGGVTLYLDSIQVAKLIPYEGRQVEALDYEDDEDDAVSSDNSVDTDETADY